MVTFYHEMLICVETFESRVGCLKVLLEREKTNLKSWMPYINHIRSPWQPYQVPIRNFCIACMEPYMVIGYVFQEKSTREPNQELGEL